MSDPGQDVTLTGPQAAVLELLLSGHTDAEAADGAGVSRRTVCRWRHDDGPFKTALAAAQEEIRAELIDDRIRAAKVGLDTLMKAARNGSESAATTLLRSVVAMQEEVTVHGNPYAGWTIDQLRRLRELEDEAAGSAGGK